MSVLAVGCIFVADSEHAGLLRKYSQHTSKMSVEPDQDIDRQLIQ